MGISCDLEVGSMDSETKPTCNREILNRSDQDACSAAAEATTASAKTPLSIVVDTIDASNATSVIDLVSPTPKEAEPILIGDDAEPEEGEIINSDSEFEYEAISSDEEFTLRQQIEALEAKNHELEKIASISSRAIDYDYIGDYHRPSIYSNYKIPLAPNRSNIAKTNASLSSTASNFKPLKLSHVECISSDEAHIIDSENELPYVLDGGGSSKLYGRSHRSTASKKEKRQSRRNKTRTGVDGGSGGDKERCLQHGKRRCTDLDCSIVAVPSASSSSSVSRKKRVRHKYDCDRKPAKSKYSSDSEDELLRNREELKMALNIIVESSTRTINTTLSHKLSAIQNQHHLDDGRKSTATGSTTAKHRKRKNAHSPESESQSTKRSKHTKATAKPAPDDRKSEHIKVKTSKPPSKATNKHNANDGAHEEDDDEQISLEEQELRLIALKSAVLKKHEARKRKQLAIVQACEQIARPYSPTDSIVLVADETGEPSESGERGNYLINGQIDSDSNNMDISPISSPTNPYQPMDMDLVSSNENSKSPIFSYEKPQTFPPFDSFIDWGTVHIPVPINAAVAAAASATYVDIDHTAACELNPPFTLQPPYSLIYDASIPEQPISVGNPVLAIPSEAKENEPNDSEADELRAKLIEQMRATNPILPNDASESSFTDAKSMSMAGVGSDGGHRIGHLNIPKDNPTSNVDSLEEDCLRSLLLSSKGKKSNILKETTNELHAPALDHSSKPNKTAESTSCDDIPKLTLNLREALKRLKNNQQNKNANSSSKKMPTISRDESNRLDKMHEDENANKHVKSLQNCDHNEIQKTVETKRIDNEENAQKIIGQPTGAAEVPSTEMKVIESVNEAKTEVEIMTPIPNESAKKSMTATTTTPAAITKPLATVAPTIEKKAVADGAKRIVASATKTTAKLVNKKEPTKKVANQSAIPQPKPKSTVESEPPATVPVPLRPKSSTPPTVSRVNASGMSLTKMESIRRSSASPVIATWIAKPVKKLIISLNEDSSTDTDDPECSTIKKTDNNTNEPTSNTFQLRLDQFLKSVRANTSTTPEKEQPAKPINTTKKTTTPKTADKKASPQKNQTSSTSKMESSKAVAHLPISSQLEYHRLLNRMKLLEKQKEQKSRLKNEQQQPALPTALVTTVPPAAVEGSFPSLTVVIQNENRIIQTNKAPSVIDDNGDKKPLELMKTANAKSSLTASNVSLAKTVLVKNAMDSLNTPTVTNDLKRSTDNNEKADVKNEPTPTIASASGAKAKPTAMSLAMFAKKTPKVRATVLANYVKKYRNQGEQYLCGLAKLHRLTSRTNLETRKQQKLEQALDELRRQTKIVEAQLAQQKASTQSLYPAMVAAEKAAHTDRIAMQKLENCCNRLGHIVNGSNYKIQSDKETEIKNKIIQITIEKNKLKLLAQNKSIVSQVPKSAIQKPPTVPSKLPPTVSATSLLPLSLPKQPSKIKPNEPAVQQQSIPTPVSKQANEPENDQKIKPAKCEPTESNQSDCKIVDASKETDVKVMGKANNVIDKEGIDSKTIAMATAVQKESTACENLNEPIENANCIEPQMDNAADENVPNQPVTGVEIVQQTSDNNNRQRVVSGVDIVETAQHVIESDKKIDDDESLTPDNVTVTEKVTEITENNAIEVNEIQYVSTGKYDSPLDHLENCVETQQSEQLSDADRNAILCPYDLMGRCEDKQCQYKHIKT